MRTREEIQVDLNRESSVMFQGKLIPAHPTCEVLQTELLLDIRDLLIDQKLKLQQIHHDMPSVWSEDLSGKSDV